jgi:pimeloyl-ACP methyl ester carboxylesterase
LKVSIMLTEQSIRLPSGATLRYVEQGPAAAVPLILLHGFPDSWLSYEPVLANLPSTIRAIALSQRGFGNSDKPDDGYDPRDLAADLAAFMKLRRIPRAVLAGHSMGALVAQRVAIDYPDLVAGLALIGTFKSLRDSVELAELIDQIAGMADPIDLDLVRAFQASTLAQPVTDEFFRTVVAEVARLPLSIWRAALGAIAAYDDFAELSRIVAPTILFWGERDNFSTYEQQQELASEIPGAELRVYAGAGHSLHWEEPKRFAGDLANFVRALEWIRAVRHPLKRRVPA